MSFAKARMTIIRGMANQPWKFVTGRRDMTTSAPAEMNSKANDSGTAMILGHKNHIPVTVGN
jgi:hypothetical protein